MKIVTVPHSALRAISQEVTDLDSGLINWIQDMETTLQNKTNPQGVGLSGPQVNHNLRVFCTFLQQGDQPPKIRTYINPRITKASDTLTLGPNPEKPILEGCLSIPHIWGPVRRHKWVQLEYFILNPQNTDLIRQKKRFESFPARVIQHELDHLNGILFTDHSLTQHLPVYQDKGGELSPIHLSDKL
jgi:peptide deformylase